MRATALTAVTSVNLYGIPVGLAQRMLLWAKGRQVTDIASSNLDEFVVLLEAVLNQYDTPRTTEAL